MPQPKVKLPPLVRAYRKRMQQRVEQTCELVADHLHEVHESEGAESLLPPLPGLSDMSLRIDDQFCEEEVVVSRWSVYAAHTGTVAGFEASLRDVTINGATISKMDGKAIVSEQSYWDANGLLSQLGGGA
jgi:predicted ester cyclase